MPSNPINLPSGYAPAFAIGFSDEAGALAVVDSVRPLPVSLAAQTLTVQTASATPPAPLTGTAASAQVVGPFACVPGRPVMIALSGTWTGTVAVQRSIDGGTTKLPLTLAGEAWGRFTANACEPVWTEEESGAALYLSLSPATGAVTYRLSQ